MNQSDINEVTTVTDSDGHSPTLSDTDRHRPTVSDRDVAVHDLTTNDVVELFELGGVQRSQRTIERYCESGKLDCVRDPDEDRWYINSESAEKLIAQIQSIDARHSTPTERPTATLESGRQEPTVSARSEDLKKLEDEVLNLKIDNSAKSQVITMMRDQIKEDREKFVSELQRVNLELGETKQKLLQLEAPKADMERHEPTVSDGVYTEASRPLDE